MASALVEACSSAVPWIRFGKLRERLDGKRCDAWQYKKTVGAVVVVVVVFRSYVAFRHDRSTSHLSLVHGVHYCRVRRFYRGCRSAIQVCWGPSLLVLCA